MNAPRRPDVPATVILHVDDEPSFLVLMAMALAQSGAPFVHHGIEDPRMVIPWLHARAVPPALIILDGRMPFLGGIALLRALRSDPRLLPLPVALLTGSLDEPLVREAAALSAVAIEAKPNTYQALLGLARRWTRLAERLSTGTCHGGGT